MHATWLPDLPVGIWQLTICAAVPLSQMVYSIQEAVDGSFLGETAFIQIGMQMPAEYTI